MPKPDVDLSIAIRDSAFFEGEAAFVTRAVLLYPDRYGQIRCSHTTCVDRSTRNFSVLIYAFRSFEPDRKATFKIVEVSGVGTLIPNNGTTIDKVRIA